MRDADVSGIETSDEVLLTCAEAVTPDECICFFVEILTSIGEAIAGIDGRAGRALFLSTMLNGNQWMSPLKLISQKSELEAV